MKYLLSVILFLNAAFCLGQMRVYTGFIGEYPIQLTAYSYTDGFTNAFYAYDKFDTPISIKGTFDNNTLILTELDEAGDTLAELVFTGTDLASNELNGEWINQVNNTKLNIRLTKSIEFDSFDDTEIEKSEFLQSQSTQNHYFKLLISKTPDEEVQVIGIRVYEKKTDKLLQEFEFNCRFLGLNNTFVGDYNFDGEEDFSVFEGNFAGANTSSIYILKSPESGKYFMSDITGTSLEFDYDAKLVYEYNQCCGGRNQTNTTYKIVNNKMVLIKEERLEYDDEKGDYIEVQCE